MKKDTSDISDNLRAASYNHKDHKPPGAPAKAEIDVDVHGDEEESQEDDVSHQRRLILVRTELNRAEGEGAVCVGAKDDDVGGHGGWRRRRHD